MCFSLANMKIVKTSSALNIASIKTPWTSDVDWERVVTTLKGVGKRTLTMKDEKIAPPSCAARSKQARKTVIALVIAIARVTAGSDS